MASIDPGEREVGLTFGLATTQSRSRYLDGYDSIMKHKSIFQASTDIPSTLTIRWCCRSIDYGIISSPAWLTLSVSVWWGGAPPRYLSIVTTETQAPWAVGDHYQTWAGCSTPSTAYTKTQSVICLGKRKDTPQPRGYAKRATVWGWYYWRDSGIWLLLRTSERMAIQQGMITMRQDTSGPWTE